MQRVNGNKNCLIPKDLLDDIASRFILDAPACEVEDPISLCFLTELAYWFYLDEYVEEDDRLNTIKFDSFALQLLQHVKIQPKAGSLEEMLQEFRDFKHRVPTYGALILNTDLSQVLLVQGFWHRASWGFPKGKINVDEEPYKCAIREVLEETGYDISSQIAKDQFLESVIGEQRVRLYIIPGVPTTTEFTPKTKGEIKELRWFPINQLPAHKNERNYFKTAGPSNMFYMVMPFVKQLREWVASSGGGADQGKGGAPGRESRRRHRSLNSSSGAALLPNPQISSLQQTTAGTLPRKRESKSRSKGAGAKKNNLQPPNQENSTMEDLSQPKAASKSRGKSSKGSHASSSSCNAPGGASQSSRANLTQLQSGFKCQSWQNFKINKKAINEALDAAWSGVTIQMQV